jgi:tRNA-specific 2-thiouridylase
MKIAVAMSGGVDSSVVAGLMARAGHEVIGIMWWIPRPALKRA